MTALKTPNRSSFLPVLFIFGFLFCGLFWMPGCGVDTGPRFSSNPQAIEAWDTKYEKTPTAGGCMTWGAICKTGNVMQVCDDGTCSGDLKKDISLVNARYGAGSARMDQTLCWDPSLPDGGYRVMIVDTPTRHQVRYYLGDEIVGGLFFTSSPGTCQYAYFGRSLPKTCCN